MIGTPAVNGLICLKIQSVVNKHENYQVDMLFICLQHCL